MLSMCGISSRLLQIVTSGLEIRVAMDSLEVASIGQNKPYIFFKFKKKLHNLFFLYCQLKRKNSYRKLLPLQSLLAFPLSIYMWSRQQTLSISKLKLISAERGILNLIFYISFDILFKASTLKLIIKKLNIFLIFLLHLAQISLKNHMPPFHKYYSLFIVHESVSFQVWNYFSII